MVTHPICFIFANKKSWFFKTILALLPLHSIYHFFIWNPFNTFLWVDIIIVMLPCFSLLFSAVSCHFPPPPFFSSTYTLFCHISLFLLSAIPLPHSMSQHLTIALLMCLIIFSPSSTISSSSFVYYTILIILLIIFFGWVCSYFIGPYSSLAYVYLFCYTSFF